MVLNKYGKVSLSSIFFSSFTKKTREKMKERTIKALQKTKSDRNRECIYNKHLVWIWKPASEGRYDSALGVLLL